MMSLGISSPPGIPKIGGPCMKTLWTRAGECCFSEENIDFISGHVIMNQPFRLEYRNSHILSIIYNIHYEPWQQTIK